MSRLANVLAENNAAAEKQGNKKVKKDVVVPTYDTSGKIVKLEKKKRNKKAIFVLTGIVAIIGLIYIPGLFMSDENEFGIESNQTVTKDATVIKLCNDFVATSLTEDFDNDGIDNSKEQVENTNPWALDTDNDGASDYYELYVSKTSPNTYDELLTMNEQEKQDNDNGNKVSTPYRIGNVILWADDYYSKALGGVIDSVNGYSFHNFTGYAQFPDNTGSYAYGVKNGIRTLLPYREAENAWRVDNYDMIEIYSEPLEEVIDFKLFGKSFYLTSNTFSKVIATVLPNKGFISATKKTRMDVEPDTRQDTVTSIVTPTYNHDDTSRFASDTTSLANLQYVRSMINEGKCVAVSLYNSNDGEYIGVVYGYTYEGDLLVADCNTLEPIGTINVKEKGKKVLIDENSFILHSYFEWSGLGFSSYNYDRISFFAVSDANGNYMNTNLTGTEQYENSVQNTDHNIVTTETVTEVTTETTTEVITEATTEVTTEATTEVTTEATTEVTTETTTEQTTTQATSEARKPSTRKPEKPKATTESNTLEVPEFN